MNKDAKALIAVTIASVAIGVTQVPAILARNATNALVAKSQAERVLETDKLTAREAARAASVAIANSRYDQGCEVIVDLNALGTASTIQEGQPIVAGTYAKQNQGKPLSRINPSHFIGRDIVVCDAYGTTALMTFDQQKGYAIASDIAVTNDRQRMAKAVQSRPGLKRPSLTK